MTGKSGDKGALHRPRWWGWEEAGQEAAWRDVCLRILEPHAAWTMPAFLLAMVVLVGWVHLFKRSIHLARLDITWYHHSCSDVMGFAEFRVKKQFIKKALYCELERNLWDGMTSTRGFLNPISLSSVVILSSSSWGTSPGSLHMADLKGDSKWTQPSVYGPSWEGMQFSP